VGILYLGLASPTWEFIFVPVIRERIMTVAVNPVCNQTNLKSVKRKSQFLFILSRVKEMRYFFFHFKIF
jgi:hypothetical protein